MKATRAYYSEIDKHCVAALRELIAMGLIPDGDVDDRSIKDVTPDDLRGYTQCHFFAGIGGWPFSTRLAGWPDDRPLWTGSCPCQPFSAAGKRGGADDPRHLWPDFFRLIRSCQPEIVVGEQVAGALGYGWLDGVLSDLESENYSGEAVDIPACSIDAPHIRNRLYWYAERMAHAIDGECDGRAIKPQRRAEGRSASRRLDAECSGEAQGLADIIDRRPGSREVETGRDHRRETGDAAFAVGPVADCHQPLLRQVASAGQLAVDEPDTGIDGRRDRGVTQGDAFGSGLEGQRWHGDGDGGSLASRSASAADGSDGAAAMDHAYGSRRLQPEGSKPGRWGRHSHADEGRNGTFWSGAEWLICHDGKARRTQPGLRLLVDGLPARIPLWRGAGNAICAPLAAEVLIAIMETRAAA